VWGRAKAAFEAAGIFGSIWTFLDFVAIALVPRFITTSDTLRAVFYVFGVIGALMAFAFTGVTYARVSLVKRRRAAIKFAVLAFFSLVVLGIIITLLDPGVAESSERVERVREWMIIFWWGTDFAIGIMALGLSYGLVAFFVALVAKPR
jgi:hypothetical protein